MYSTEDNSEDLELTRTFDDLVRLQIELWNTIDLLLQSTCDLSMGWFQVMRLVGRIDSCRVNDIAEELLITVGGASKVVDRIEAAKFCRRRSNPEDRRSSIIELTPSGRSKLREADALYTGELRRRLAEPLPPRTLRQLGATLHRLRIAGHNLDS